MCVDVVNKPLKYFCAVPINVLFSNVLKARKIYGVEKVIPSEELASRTGCSVEALDKIVKKGEAAYYSSGSRPNQTGHSWGYARMASAITSGKAAAVDYNILEEGCSPTSKALMLANVARKKHKFGKRKVPLSLPTSTLPAAQLDPSLHVFVGSV